MRRKAWICLGMLLLLTGCTGEAHEHEFKATLSVLPTCTEEGVLHYACDCGEVYDEAVPALGHEREVRAGLEPTCTQAGYTEEMVCSRCGTVLLFKEELPALGHSYENGTCIRCHIEQSVWDGTVDTDWYTEERASFAITSPEAFAGLAKLVNEGISFEGKTIALQTDLRLNETKDWERWEFVPPLCDWTPIGTEEHPFRGNFLGNGHKIDGLYSTKGSLFGCIENAIVSDFILTKGFLTGENNVAPIGKANKSKVGYVFNETCLVTSSGKYAGGIVGYADHGTISNCTTFARIEGYYSVGGIAGYASGTVQACSMKGTVHASGIYAGSIVGYLYYGKVENCEGEQLVGNNQGGSVS